MAGLVHLWRCPRGHLCTTAIGDMPSWTCQAQLPAPFHAQRRRCRCKLHLLSEHDHRGTYAAYYLGGLVAAERTLT